MENQNQYQTNKCVYCSRTYKKKENYSKHVITCAFFHNVHLQSRDDFNLSVEDLPSQREMFLLMKELANKCHELEKKLGHLEQTVNIRQKKQIITWLNTHRTTNITPNSEGEVKRTEPRSGSKRFLDSFPRISEADSEKNTPPTTNFKGHRRSPEKFANKRKDKGYLY